MYIKYKNYLIIVFIFSVGVLLSFLLFFWLEKNEAEFAQEKFSQLIHQYATAVEHSLQEETRSLNALSAYHYGSEYISVDEFKVFAFTIMKNHSSVQALEWVPEVLYKDKNEYEKDFSFKEYDGVGKLVPVQNRSIYYPTYYLEPFHNNEKALGFDLGSEKNRLEALTLAKKSANIVASKPVKLILAKEQRVGLVIFQPIYEQKEKKSGFIGLYANVIKAETLISGAMAKVSKRCEGVNMDVYDVEADNSKRLVHSIRCKHGLSEVTDIRAQESIEFAGRVWKFKARATKIFRDQYMTGHSYIVLAISSMLTILISFVFYQMQKGYRVVSESNRSLRRFQKLAVGREQRMAQLKKENLKLKSLKEGHSAE